MHQRSTVEVRNFVARLVRGNSGRRYGAVPKVVSNGLGERVPVVRFGVFNAQHRPLSSLSDDISADDAEAWALELLKAAAASRGMLADQ